MPKKNKNLKVYTSLSGVMGYNPMKAIEEMQADLKGKGTRKSKSKVKLVKKQDGGVAKKPRKYNPLYPKMKYKRKGIMVTPIFPKGYKDFTGDAMRKAHPLPKLTPRQKKLNKIMKDFRKKQSLERDPSGFTQLLTNGGEAKKPKSKLLIKKPKVKPKTKITPYIDFNKSKEFAKNEKAGAVIKQDTAKLGANIGRNLNVGITYDKNKYAKKNFTQKTIKKGVEAGLHGRKGSVSVQVGKQSQSNPFEGKQTGKYMNIRGRINFNSFSKGGRAAIRGTKFTGVK